MGFLARRRVSRLVDQISADAGNDRQALTEAQLILREHADLAVPQLVAALARTGPESNVARTLRALSDNATLPYLAAGLAHADPRVAESVAEILAETPGLRVDSLVGLYQDPAVNKPLLTRVLTMHRASLHPAPLFRTLPGLPEETRPAFFDLLARVIDESSLDDLIGLLDTDDPGLKLNIIKVLRRFPNPAAAEALLAQLEDRRKSIRLAALDSLGELAIPIDTGRLCAALRDPDMVVQSRAIDAIARRQDPASVRYLLEVLQDESEYVRRAAVEVLNRVGTTAAIKDLIAALEDSDWWVRVRAADALGEIGGEKVVDAVLELTTDKELFVRRFAVEILNNHNDPRARPYLEQALLDADWWVRERAIDALALLGDRSVVPRLIELLDQDRESAPHALRALAQLGDSRALSAVEAQLQGGDRAIRKEAERALAVLRGEQPAPIQQRKHRDPAFSGSGLPTGRGSLESQLQGTATTAGDSTLPAVTRPDGLSDTLIQGSGGATTLPDGRTQRFDLGDLAPGDLIADRYRVVRRIGRGAFGEVVLVDDTVVGEQIILKFLHRHLTGDPEVIQRFVHELRYARRITHENVIRIFDFITVDSQFAMSMEYFASRSLAAILKAGPVEPGAAVRYVRDICRGMEVAHQAGVVHRDLKPGNVLINDTGLVKVVDFGLAAATGHLTTRMTRAGVILGTPAYMAPEQIRGEDIDPRTDIYSLGIIMYELFTGVPPYRADDPMAVLFQHIEGKPMVPLERAPDLPEALAALILKSMALKPDERFQSMTELDAALASLDGGNG